jgi:thioredoxin 1
MGIITAPELDPGLNSIFSRSGLTPSNFDSTVLTEEARLKVVFFWGQDCPNCVVAKEHMREMAAELSQLAVDFHSVDAYTHMDLATRFGLFGIPVYLFFKRGRLIGRVTSFPGRAELLAVVRRYV